MNKSELEVFLKKYGLEASELAEVIGLTRMAVEHWLSGRRAIAKPYGRLMRMFDRHPELMREFK